MAADARGRLWKYLEGLLPPGCHATRIENEIGAGFPDVHYTYLEVTGTIELKDTDRLPMGKAGMRKAQIRWIEEEIEAGGLVWILVRFKKRYFVVSGLYAESLNDWDEKTIGECCAAQWLANAYDPDILYGVLRNSR